MLIRTITASHNGVMRIQQLPLLAASLLLFACVRNDTTPNIEIENPDLWVNRIFSSIENNNTTHPILLPGQTVSAFVSKPENGETLQVFLNEHGSLPVSASIQSPFDDFIQVSFALPSNIDPGDYLIRFEAGEESSSWIELPISTPEQLLERETVSSMAMALPEAATSGVSLLIDYKPLPKGIHIVDGISGEHSYGPTNGSEWLVYGVNPGTGLAQPDAFWAVGDPVQGLTVVANPLGPTGPIKPIGWPVGRDSSDTYYAIRDFSNPINQNNQVFDAAPEGGQGKPIKPPTTTTPTPPTTTPPPPPTGYGVTGDLGPCPNGIKTHSVVLQFDDNTGFDWLLTKTGKVLKELGANQTTLVSAEQLSDSQHRYDANALKTIMENVARGLDCDCDELIVSIICHGIADRNGKHFLIFKDRPKPKKKIPTEDVMKLIAKALHDTGKDCVPVTVLLQPCYSGAALDEIPDAVEEGAGGPRPNFRVIAAAAADQTANGDFNGKNGYPDIYFLEALLNCMKDQRFDLNQDRKVSLQEAWICLLEEIWMRSMSRSRRPQDPKKWPNP